MDFEPMHRLPKLLAVGFFLRCVNNAALLTSWIAFNSSLVY
jgi:hypothetical protein